MYRDSPLKKFCFFILLSLPLTSSSSLANSSWFLLAEPFLQYNFGTLNSDDGVDSSGIGLGIRSGILWAQYFGGFEYRKSWYELSLQTSPNNQAQLNQSGLAASANALIAAKGLYFGMALTPFFRSWYTYHYKTKVSININTNSTTFAGTQGETYSGNAHSFHMGFMAYYGISINLAYRIWEIERDNPHSTVSVLRNLETSEYLFELSYPLSY